MENLWFEIIDRMYKSGLWQLWQVQAVVNVRITPEEYELITGLEYEEDEN